MSYTDQIQKRQALKQEAQDLLIQLENTFGVVTVMKHHELKLNASGARFLLARLEDCGDSIISRSWVAEWTQNGYSKLIKGWSENNNIDSVVLAAELRVIAEENDKAIEALYSANPGFSTIYAKHMEALNDVNKLKIEMNSVSGHTSATPSLYNKAEHQSVTGQLALLHNPDLTPSQSLLLDSSDKVPSQLDAIQSDNVLPDGYILPQLDNKHLKSAPSHMQLTSMQRQFECQHKVFKSWKETQLEQVKNIKEELGDQYTAYSKVADLSHDLNYISFILFRSYNSNRRLTQGIINRLRQQHHRDMLQPYFAYTIGKVEAILEVKEKEAFTAMREFGKLSPTLQKRFTNIDEFERKANQRTLMTNTIYGSFGTAPSEEYKTAVRYLKQMAEAAGVDMSIKDAVRDFIVNIEPGKVDKLGLTERNIVDVLKASPEINVLESATLIARVTALGDSIKEHKPDYDITEMYQNQVEVFKDK